MTDCGRCGGEIDATAWYFELEHPGTEGGEPAYTALGLCADCASSVAAEALKVSVR